MKKYLTIAAVLGVIAFASVSFLAQADQQPAAKASSNVMVKEKAVAVPAPAKDESDGEAAADKAEAVAIDSKFDKDDQECAEKAATPGKDGAEPSDADQDVAYKKCMTDKGHTEAELKAAAGDAGGKSGVHDQGERAEE